MLRRTRISFQVRIILLYNDLLVSREERLYRQLLRLYSWSRRRKQSHLETGLTFTIQISRYFITYLCLRSLITNIIKRTDYRIMNQSLQNRESFSLRLLSIFSFFSSLSTQKWPGDGQILGGDECSRAEQYRLSVGVTVQEVPFSIVFIQIPCSIVRGRHPLPSLYNRM